ncbi:arginase family protein [Candidatus Bipolaricaulota bacterium]|nr:arginase family protein [Candidatus Bipolaricaulota bacterium]
MTGRPLRRLSVVGVRYRTTTPAEDDERGLDAYAASGVYASAGVPFHVVEPRLPETAPSIDLVLSLGFLNGAIAEAVAAGRRTGAAILMTGGDCTHVTGVVGGLQDAHGPGLRLGLVWFDAHGDFNTPETTPSGMLGGMPVAVCAGLAHAPWRELSHIAAPIPTDRILFVDVRNLDPPEEDLIWATDASVAAVAPGFPGEDLAGAVARLDATCDAIALHIDADILDASLVPSHGTKEPNGPDLEETAAAIETVMATGKVVTLALVSIYNRGDEGRLSMASGIELLRRGLASWRTHGTASLPVANS